PVAGLLELLRLLALDVAAPERHLADAARHRALGGAIERRDGAVEVAALLRMPGELHPLLVVPDVVRKAEGTEPVMRRLAVAMVDEDRSRDQHGGERAELVPPLRLPCAVEPLRADACEQRQEGRERQP